MRRPCADREEKRVTHGNETNKKEGFDQELDFNNETRQMRREIEIGRK
jgi:hypothetical protein